uniref:Uncharacterized protein n=1 Tax=Mycena chlorophos TaxID=658473 RepID=A0ABQ0LCV6_MYCCL|nr:predicted protein [Mycena chlorophos]
MQAATTLPFRIPWAWERNRPRFEGDSVEELVDFLEMVDTIIDEQGRKHLLTSYLPVSKRTLWRSLETYTPPHSYTEFVAEVQGIYPELAERENGTIAELEELCRENNGLDGTNEGRLRRFGWVFGMLVQKLQRPPAILTNRDACRMYLDALGSVFAKQVRTALLERAALLVTGGGRTNA